MVKVGYFLEDLAHLGFIKTFVNRYVLSRGVQMRREDHLDYNVTGGNSDEEYATFIADYSEIDPSPFDILIVAKDANCVSYAGKRKQLERICKDKPFPWETVFVIPDPHIERWYLNDPGVLSKILGTRVTPPPLKYKCDKDHYKNLIKRLINKAGVKTISYGYEYGPIIAESINIPKVARIDSSFKYFVRDLKNALSTHLRIT